MKPADTPDPEFAGSFGRAAADASTGAGSGGAAAREFDCIQCGYALRGLPAAGRCPECARPVADSLGRWELRYAERGHLKRLSLGLWLIISGTAWFSIGFIALDGLWFLGFIDAPGVAMVRYSLAGSVFVAGIGVWLFTRVESRASGRQRSVASRRIARTATVVYAFAVPQPMYLLSLLFYLIRWYVLPANQMGAFTVLGKWEWLFFYGLPAVIVGCRAVLLTALMHRARELAERAEDAVLVRRCEFFRWLLPLLAVLGGGWVFVPSRDYEPYTAIRLMTPTALILACFVLRCVHKHVREVLVLDAVKKDYGSN